MATVQLQWHLFPLTLLICLQNISVADTTEHQSIQNSTHTGKPRVELTNNRKIVIDNVMANNKISIFKPLLATSDGLGITLIIIRKGFFSLRIIDAKTVDVCDIL